jgi:hypothetical protein
MGNTSPKLEWCIVRLGEDMNWWVDEISDDIHWDVDGLSIIDPRQMSHIMDQIDPLRDYDMQQDVVESAFYRFKVDKTLDNNRIRLVRTSESLFDSDEMLFALPDVIDEEKGPYADFLDHAAHLRVKLLNDCIKFERKLTVEELEEEIREEQNQAFMEGRATHVFSEVSAIIEYVPAGYELEADPDEDGPPEKAPEDQIDDFPDIDEDEKIEEDETMKWDDENDEKAEEDEFDRDEDEEDADEDADEDPDK